MKESLGHMEELPRQRPGAKGKSLTWASLVPEPLLLEHIEVGSWGQDKAEVLSRLQTTQHLAGRGRCLSFILVQREADLEKCLCNMLVFNHCGC